MLGTVRVTGESFVLGSIDAGMLPLSSTIWQSRNLGNDVRSAIRASALKELFTRRRAKTPSAARLAVGYLLQSRKACVTAAATMPNSLNISTEFLVIGG